MRTHIKWTSKCASLAWGNSPANGEFPAQKASNTAKSFHSWRHHVLAITRRKVITSIRAYLQFEHRRHLSRASHRNSLDLPFRDSTMKGFNCVMFTEPRTRWGTFRRRHFQTHFLKTKIGVFFIKIPLRFVPDGPIDYSLSLIELMAWCGTSDD